MTLESLAYMYSEKLEEGMIRRISLGRAVILILLAPGKDKYSGGGNCLLPSQA